MSKTSRAPGGVYLAHFPHDAHEIRLWHGGATNTQVRQRECMHNSDCHLKPRIPLAHETYHCIVPTKLMFEKGQ